MDEESPQEVIVRANPYVRDLCLEVFTTHGTTPHEGSWFEGAPHHGDRHHPGEYSYRHDILDVTGSRSFNTRLVCFVCSSRPRAYTDDPGFAQKILEIGLRTNPRSLIYEMLVICLRRPLVHPDGRLFYIRF